MVDDAVLLTSELVTNAVVHAGTPVQVTCKLAAGAVEVVVRDSHPARMVPGPVKDENIPAERTSGRGLLLPSALASAWGVTYGRGGQGGLVPDGPAGRAGQPDCAGRRPGRRERPCRRGWNQANPGVAAAAAGPAMTSLLARRSSRPGSSLGADAAYALVAGRGRGPAGARRGRGSARPRCSHRRPRWRPCRSSWTAG